MKNLTLFILLALLALTAGPALAAQEAPPFPSDPAELETFIDGLVAAEMDARHVAGITISVVKDGELFFSKGYGYADLERRIPVDPQGTLFRAGSVSKLFVWTAVMQLVEQGRLNLDENIETYLDFSLPDTYEQPVTLRHIMTHTPGFEDQGDGLFVRTAAEVDPLGAYLSGHIPRRVFPPGEIAAYSNYGAATAGYIVERVAGMPFYDYVEMNILQPLGMSRTTFRQPPPGELGEALSKGYRYTAGEYEEGGFEFVQPYPAGSMSITAADAAIFMIAHLQNGQYGDARILQEETARQMHQLAFSLDPRLEGWGLGFAVGEINQLPAFGHGGDTVYFHTDMTMIPAHNLGIFISTNTDTGAAARSHLVLAILDRYFPAELPQPAAEPPPGFAARAEQYSGTYWPARMNFSTPEKSLALFQPVVVSPATDGRLMVTGLLGPEPSYWAETEPGLFVPTRADFPMRAWMLFSPAEGAEGSETQYIYLDDNVFIKQPWYAGPGFQLPMLGLAALFFLGAIIAVPLSGITHRSYRRMAPDRIPPMPGGARVARWVAWLFALLALGFLIVLVVLLSDINNVIFGVPPEVEWLFLAPFLLAALAALVVLFAIAAFVEGWWSVGARVWYTLLALMAVGFVAFLWFWQFFVV